MRKSLIITLIAGAMAMLGVASCSKNVYDEETHRQLIKYFSAVDSVDQQHEWKLSEFKSYRYQVPSGNYQQLRIYSANPLTSSKAELMHQIFVSGNQSGVLSVDVPYQITTLYAAIVDASGNLTVTSFPASQASTETFDFTSATTGKAVTSALQTYTYLFEENYPEPGDYDYNDVVLRVSQQRTPASGRRSFWHNSLAFATCIADCSC